MPSYASRYRLDKAKRLGESATHMRAPGAAKGLVPTMVSKHVKDASGQAVLTAVTHRILPPTAALVLLALPWDIGAQVGPDLMDVWAPQEPMPLSAAIAKIRQSPFHSVAWSAGQLDDTFSRATLRASSAPDLGYWRYQEASENTVVSAGWVFAATTVGGVLGYLGTAYCCAYSDSHVLVYSIPITAVGVAAWVAGADPGRAAIGSIVGGAVGISLALAVGNPIGLAFGFSAHVGVTTLASKIHFRRRPRP